MIAHPYARFLKDVEKPGRYLGGEFGAAAPDENAALRVVLSYPDTYEIGMSHIGLGVLYETANSLDGVSCERVFMPWGDMEAALRERRLPLVSLESATPLDEFDVLGFTLQYELTYTNLIAMLDMGRIPRYAADRDERHPLVIVGGPLAAHCEPIAPFVDCVVVGDGEEALPCLLKTLLDAKAEGCGRIGRLGRLNALPFAYAPGAYTRTVDLASGRAVVEPRERAASWAAIRDLGAYRTGGTISPAVETVFDRFSLEVSRGCGGGCRFCQAGFLYRPVRERDEAAVSGAVERAVSCTGFDAVSLASLSTADHSRIVPMLASLGEAFTPRRVSFFVPSLRAYGLDDAVVEVLSRLRATGVTLAPEAGSQRLRNVINKNITEDDLLVAASRFFGWGLTRIKLYFMLGLPTETDDDLAEIVALAARLRDFGRRRLRGRTPAITVSVSTFVPKPFTPFACEPMVGAADIRRRQKILLDLGRRERLEVRVHSDALSILEGVLCRGDVSLAPMLARAVDMGARFDGWSDRYREDIWSLLLSEQDLERLLGPLPPGGRVPWDHVSAGADDTFLARERSRAAAASVTPPCGRFRQPGGEGQRVVCHHCGAACDRETLPLRDERPTADPDSLPPPGRPQKGHPRPRAHVDAVPVVPSRVMLYLAKWGRQAFVGHLDTVRHVMRALRRAGLDLHYTQGFNPKPKLSSAPPLPLGTAAMADPYEVFLIHPPSADEILSRLSACMPADMAVVQVELLPREGRSMSKRLIAAELEALLPAPVDAVSQGISRVLSAPALPVQRTRKGKTTTVDIRPFIRDLALGDSPSPDLPLPPPGDRISVTFSLYLPGSGGCKPSELLREIAGDAAADAWVVRRAVSLEPLQ